jgi:hypothetical protein
MRKNDLKEIRWWFCAICIVYTVSYGLYWLRNKCIGSKKDICWTSTEVEGYYDIDNKKVAFVTLGLRKDGVVVWREEKVEGSEYKSSCLFFDTNNVVGAKK